MGRKTEKGKVKRQMRKEEAKHIAAAQILVDKANAQDNPLSQFPVFQNFCKNNLSASLFCTRSTDLDSDTMNWIFNLEERNMKQLYLNCSWGWNEKLKQEEMTDERAWYLIAKNDNGEGLGFSHFRFDMDYGTQVLYCYELQLESECRRKGLGKFMMQVLELMAFTAQMKKVVLTVLKHNPEAMNFFQKLNYTIDETSPEDSLFEEFPYIILSKINKKLL